MAVQDRSESPKWDGYFSQNVRIVREREGMTQTALAERMSERGFSFHQATVYKLEKGSRKVSLGEAMAIASILGVSINSLASAPLDMDAEAFGAAIYERASTTHDALMDIWAASDRFVASQESLIAILDDLLVADPADSTPAIQTFTNPTDEEDDLRDSIPSIFVPLASNDIIRRMRDELIYSAQYGELYSAFSRFGWPGTMGDDPELDQDRFTSWADFKEQVSARLRAPDEPPHYAAWHAKAESEQATFDVGHLDLNFDDADG